MTGVDISTVNLYERAAAQLNKLNVLPLDYVRGVNRAYSATNNAGSRYQRGVTRLIGLPRMRGNNYLLSILNIQASN